MGQRTSSLGTFCRVDAFACVLLGYVVLVVLGGLVFWVVEMPVELKLREEVKELRRSFLQENPCVQEKSLTRLLEKALTAYQRDVAVLEADGEERHYDFTSALYFVIVTLTTMGSDSFSPTSDEAKLFCIVFCMLGIPLTLFLLMFLSDLLLPVVTYAPILHLRTFWGLPSARASLVHSGLLLVLVVAFLFLLPALIFSLVEPAWSFLDALFFCFVILSTVGQGGSSLGRNWSHTAKEMLELFTTCYLLVGLVVILTFKETVMQVPQVRAMIRLCSGLQYGGLEEEEDEGEETQYCLHICTISSSHMRTTTDPQTSRTTGDDDWK
ncbi:potassium channel, subfamily K, member 7 [Genypterus blacodes]|uniref:potassium channel, subfamily K, member 7 n=1 Tax=Genypterus blacodes TaxID=154954 RepID=UPI003F76CD76